MGENQRQLEGLRQLGEPTPDGRVEVGPTNPYLVPFTRVNMVSQIRQDIDPKELEKLTRSLIIEDSDGRRSIGLIQPPTMGYFQRHELERYLSRVNSVWGSNHSIEDLIPVVPGGDAYLVVVAGHRRMIAIHEAAKLIEENEPDSIDPESIDVVAHIKTGDALTFREGIKVQYRENFHKRPESWEDAMAVSAILRDGIECGDYDTFADCARDLGITADRVSRAYRFNSLPAHVREMVQNKVLHYRRSIVVHDLAVAYAFYITRDALDDETRARIDNSLRKRTRYLPDALNDLPSDIRNRFFNKLDAQVRAVIKLSSFEKVERYARELIDNWLGYMDYDLVLSDEEAIANRAAAEHRRGARHDAIEALRELSVVLAGDRERLNRGEVPAVSTSTLVPELIRYALRALEALSGVRRDSGLLVKELRTLDTGEAALAILIEALETERREDNSDPMTAALGTLSLYDNRGVS